MEWKIREIVDAALAELGASVSFAVERPGDLAHGDYAVNAAMVAAKELKKNPRELAELLVEKLRSELGDLASKVEAAGPGFVNVTLSKAAVDAVLKTAQGDAWGRSIKREGERVIIEYSNANPFKEMHLGHLMGTILGEAEARLIESSGATVIRESYGGDVGPHVAKTLWALRKDGITDVANANEVDQAYVRGARAYEESEEIKREIDELNRAIYAGTDAQLMDLWRKCREVCLEAFRAIYARLGSSFDYFFFESETSDIGMRIVADGLEKGVFEKSEGAIIYKGEKKGLHTLVFVTSANTPTYETKDLGLAFMKEERVASDRSIIVTGMEQIGHFKVLLAALEEIAPNIAAKTSHISHGLLRLPGGGKMSSREGVVTAESLIRDMSQKAAEKNPDPLVAEQVALGAVKYTILRQAPGQDVIFDPEKSLSLEGDSGPYLQYALVRARSVLAQAEGKGDFSNGPDAPYQIERLLIHFPSVVARASKDLAPQLLTTYLTELAGAWNSFYAAERIIGGEHEAYKLAVAQAFVETMNNGLAILAIPAPERM